MAEDEAKRAAGDHRAPQAWRARRSRVDHRGSTVSLMPLLHSAQILSVPHECWAWWAGQTLLSPEAGTACMRSSEQKEPLLSAEFPQVPANNQKGSRGCCLVQGGGPTLSQN